MLHWLMSIALALSAPAPVAVSVADPGVVLQTDVMALPPELKLPHLGDIVICAEIVEREAVEQNKAPTAHWAHMIVHGTLHLLGYDHIDDADADIMETLEIEILQSLNFANPYHEDDVVDHGRR